MSNNPAIAQWRSRVSPGMCPGKGCKNKVPEGRVVCSRKACRDEYVEVFQFGRRGKLTALRSFKVEAVPGKPFRVRLCFTPCGHSLEVPRSKASDKGQTRRKCDACARGEAPVSSAPAT